MKKVLMRTSNILILIVVSASVLIVLTLVISPKTHWPLVWRDDFNYQSPRELQNAGWTIGPGHGGPFFGGGKVSLYEDTSIGYSNFQDQIFEFSVETGLTHAGIIIVTTQRHTYNLHAVYAGDQGPVPGRYAFEVDEQTKFQMDIADWSQPELHALTIELKHRVFSVYADNALMGNYVVPDTTPDALSSVMLGGGGGIYDYIIQRVPDIFDSGLH